jgi:hypothetical protein
MMITKSRVLTEPRKDPVASRNRGVRITEDAEVETLLDETPGDSAHREVEIRIEFHHRRHASETGLGGVRYVNRWL